MSNVHFTGTYQSAGVIQAAYELNCPLQVHSLEVPADVASCKEFVTIDTPSVILETLKKVNFVASIADVLVIGQLL